MRGFSSCPNSEKNFFFQSLYGFEVFNYIFKSITTQSLYDLKASKLERSPISTFSFMRWCQFIAWLKSETCPSSMSNVCCALFAGKRIFDSSRLNPWPNVFQVINCKVNPSFALTCADLKRFTSSLLASRLAALSQVGLNLRRHAMTCVWFRFVNSSVNFSLHILLIHLQSSQIKY